MSQDTTIDNTTIGLDAASAGELQRRLNTLEDRAFDLTEAVAVLWEILLPHGGAEQVPSRPILYLAGRLEAHAVAVNSAVTACWDVVEGVHGQCA